MTCLVGVAAAQDVPVDPYGSSEDAPVNPYLDEPVPEAPAKPVVPARVTTAAPELEPVDPYAEPTLLLAYAPVRVVGIMIETGQVLLWDELDNVYRLGRVGEEVHGWRIMAVEAERVIVAQAGVRDELPLTPAPTVKKPFSSKKKVPPTIVVAVPEPEKEPQVIPARVEPTVVPVPPDRVPVFTPAPAQAPEPAKPAPAAPTELRMTLARAELDRELTDFDKLMTTVSVAEVEGGGFKLTRVDGKSYVHKLGLRAGDVVVSIAGQQVSNVDDAARVYARLRTAKSFVVELDRTGARVTMRYDVK